MISNSFVFSENNDGIVLLAINAIVLFLLGFPLRGKLGSITSRNIYIWSNIITTSLLIWTTLSPHYAVALPVLIIIAALIVNKRTLFLISIFSILSIVVFGMMRVNGWEISSNPTFGYWQLFDSIIMLSSAIYTGLKTSLDIKYTLRILNEEAQKVTESYSKIKGLEDFDPLTGLMNKSYCDNKYIKLSKNADTNKEKVIVFLFDLDNFKSINDYYNRTLGDRLLKKVAQRVIENIEDKDIACRLDGDEFILILKRPSQFDVEKFARSFLNDISRPMNLGTEVLNITASMGISIARKKDIHFDDIRQKTDLALSKAKSLGENIIYSYNDDMHKQLLTKVTIVKQLKEAFKNDDLEVYLQPKVDMISGKVTSAEALLRWTRNNDQNIGPAEFIPLIESTELISEIGEWVIHHACRLCKEWHDNGYTDLSIAVNISSSQFLRGGLESVIEKELERSQLPAKFLELELTEYAVFHNNELILDQLKSLKKLGVMLSIDDFGTGYSNLEYLTKFNVDQLKIDGSFVKGIQDSAESLAIVNTIVKLAQSLELKVVVEGIETDEQWKILTGLGCHLGQGYLWSKALTSNNFKRYLDDNHSVIAHMG